MLETKTSGLQILPDVAMLRFLSSVDVVGTLLSDSVTSSIGDCGVSEAGPVLGRQDRSCEVGRGSRAKCKIYKTHFFMFIFPDVGPIRMC